MAQKSGVTDYSLAACLASIRVREHFGFFSFFFSLVLYTLFFTSFIPIFPFFAFRIVLRPSSWYSFGPCSE